MSCFGCFVVNELKEKALQRYNAMKGSDPEQLVSGSDDFTLCLWNPGENKKPVARMTGEGKVGEGWRRWGGGGGGGRMAKGKERGEWMDG